MIPKELKEFLYKKGDLEEYDIKDVEEIIDEYYIKRKIILKKIKDLEEKKYEEITILESIKLLISFNFKKYK